MLSQRGSNTYFSPALRPLATPVVRVSLSFKRRDTYPRSDFISYTTILPSVQALQNSPYVILITILSYIARHLPGDMLFSNHAPAYIARINFSSRFQCFVKRFSHNNNIWTAPPVISKYKPFFHCLSFLSYQEFLSLCDYIIPHVLLISSWNITQ